MNTPPRAPRRPDGAFRFATFTLAVATVVLGVVGSVEAYRFYGYSGSQWFLGYGLVPVAEDALRWSPEVWGPGETLVFEIAPDPGWELAWGSVEAALPYVERALNEWSSIPTADISWSVVVGETREARADGRNTVSLIMDYDNAYGSGLFERSGEGADSLYEIVECDVGLGLTIPEDLEPVDIEEYLERYREVSVHVFVHEFGHCLGLQHADILSINPRRRSYQADGTRLSNAAMSYGWSREYINADDRVGASLLRPVVSSAAESGSVPGVVLVDGEPVPYAHVWALPFGPAPLPGLIGVFTDGDGAFLLEGLEPGDYALWAQPIADHNATPDLLAEGAIWDLTDTIVGRRVQVRAGATTANVQIPMRRGRAPRPPPEEAHPEWKRSSLTSMRRAEAEVCPGLRVEAERPYPAGGPLWLSRQEFNDGRDQWFATTVTVAWSPRADGTVLDWAGPYRDWWWTWSDDGEVLEFVPAWVEGGERRQWGARGPFLDVWILDYRIEKRGSVARHTIEFAWPGAAEATLRFRSADDSSACDGEPRIVCNVAGCELRRWPERSGKG